METQPQQPVGERKSLRILYWIAAAVMTVAAVLELREDPDYLRASSRLALVIALILLATAKPAETRGKKILIYAMLAVATGLFLTRLISA